MGFSPLVLSLRGAQLLLQVTVRELLAQVRQGLCHRAFDSAAMLYDTLDDLQQHGKVVYHAHSANADYRTEEDIVQLKAPSVYPSDDFDDDEDEDSYALSTMSQVMYNQIGPDFTQEAKASSAQKDLDDTLSEDGTQSETAAQATLTLALSPTASHNLALTVCHRHRSRARAQRGALRGSPPLTAC